jgi:hypothetical protein
MRKSVLVILSILTFCFVRAQQNLNLEAWTVKSSGSDSADYWLNPTDAVAYGAPQNLFHETASVAQGTSAARLTTVYWAAGSMFGLDTLVGVIMQQVAYTSIPLSISFSCKSNPMQGDQNIIAAQLTHWDSVNNVRVVDGESIFITSAVNNNWTPQNVNFTYYTNNTPDTLTIVAAASANILFGDGSFGYAKIGSELFVDDFSINFATGVNNLLSIEELKIFPNPVVSDITILNSSENPLKIQVFDISGKLMLVQNLNKGKNILNIQHFNSGIYIYKITNFTNQIVKTGKLTKQ